MRAHGQHGASTVEWLAVLLVCAALVAVVVGSGAGERLRAEVRDAVCVILRADCPPAEAARSPGDTDGQEPREPDRAHRDLDGGDGADPGQVAEALADSAGCSMAA